MGRQQRLKREREHPQKRARKPSSLLGGTRGLVLVSIVAILVVGGLALVQLGADLPSTPLASGSPSPVVRVPMSGASKGDPAAPVVIEEWADFQCPACGQFYRSTEQLILGNLVATGKARFVFRNFAFLGEESNWAAEAAACAKDEGHFWEFHDAVFARQSGENTGTFTKANLKTIGRTVGLSDAFAACVDSGRHAADVRAETQAGAAKGVTATPTLFINGQKIEGVPQYERVRALVEQLTPAQ